MRIDGTENKTPPGGFLARLRRDKGGNVVAMMAVALIPTSAFAGSAVDMARLYLVKSRLQQACDAGVLAGRRVMIDDDDNKIDPEARKQAETFFDNNFKSGWMNTYDVKRTFNETGSNQAEGTAEVMVPMTIMRMFAQGDKKVSVACAARLDIPDVDVMLVLDTTGSMACSPQEPGDCSQAGTRMSYIRSDGTTGYAAQEKSTSRIVGLRTAVLDFYDAMDTYTDDRTRVRYGFVPYTSTVNAGRAVPASWVESAQARYWTRRPSADANDGNAFDRSSANVLEADCRRTVRNPAPTSTRPLIYQTNGRAEISTFKSWTQNGSSGRGTCVVSVQRVMPRWQYRRETTVDVSRYVAGDLPDNLSRYDGKSVRWQGCLEETASTPATSFNANSLPVDLDPDKVPGTDRPKLAPMWPEQVYNAFRVRLNGWQDWRNDTEVPDTYNATALPGQSGNYRDLGHQFWLERGHVSCGAPVQRLREMSRTEVQNYVTAPEFRPLGGTYHDTGMIWATRFMSPTGPFRNDTSTNPGRSEPNRHIIFMTDGEMKPNADLYGMYGLERFDGRVGGGDVSEAGLTARHNARFRAVCEAARNRNITVWVIAFGQSLNADLEACATAPAKQHAIFAGSNQALTDAFRRIAKQVASLRVYQ